jgi:hypothetical protein
MAGGGCTWPGGGECKGGGGGMHVHPVHPPGYAPDGNGSRFNVESATTLSAIP